MMLAAGVGLGVGGIFLGAVLGAKSPATTLLFAWDGVVFGFFIFWFSGLMVEIQRSESIDMTKLLHLPVTLQQVFVFNYLASHFTPSIVIFGPGMIGLCIGLVIGGGIGMAPLLLALLGFLFSVTAWTYCLRGWLAALMSNKRRRRIVIMWITIMFVLVGQLPNLVAHSSWFRFQKGPKNTQTAWRSREQFERLLDAHALIPPGWPGYSAMTLKNGNAWPALGLACAGFCLGGLGLVRAYRLTIYFYRGADDSLKTVRVRRPSAKPRSRSIVERTLPWLPEEANALALATFRSLLRAPELKMALIAPAVVAIVLVVPFLGKAKTLSPLVTGAAMTGAVALAAFATAPTMSNAFGLDRDGFRALVLLPTRRDFILLAKNLAFLPFTVTIALVFLVLMKLLGHAPWTTFLTGIAQIPTAFLMFSLMCNLSSILVPCRLAQGTLQAKKLKPIMFIAMFASMLLTPVVLLPVVLPLGIQMLFTKLGWTPWLPINLISALVIFAGVFWLYRVLLPLEGRLLHRREQAILREVTQESE